MRNQARCLWLLVATTFQVDKRRAIATLIEPLGQAAAPLCGLWLALMVNGVTDRRPQLIAIGVAGIAVFQSLGAVGDELGASVRVTLSEAVGHAFDRQIAELTVSLPGLEHAENPDYQERLELLRRTQQFGLALDNLTVAANSVVGAVVVLALLARTDPLLLGLVAFGLPSLFAAPQTQRRRRRAEEASAEPRRVARQLQGLLLAPAAGAELRVSGLRGELVRRQRQAWLASQAPTVRVAKQRAAISLGEQLLFVAGLGGAIALTFWRAVHGQVTVGEVLLVAVVGAEVQSRVLGPIYTVAGLGQDLRAAERLLWLKQYAQANRPTGQLPPPTSLTEGIRLENVGFRYPGSDRWVLRHVSMLLPAGSVIALVGDNGAGKSTLVKLLCRFYEPTEGRILIDDIDLRQLDVSQWRQQLTAAFQDYAHPELLAREVVGIGDLPQLDNTPAILGALARAGAEDIPAAIPQGLDTQLGATWTGGVDLSTGQWQKLALARGLMRDTPVVTFFDEPTASLDALTEHAIFERYAHTARQARQQGQLTILVSHRFSTVNMADLIAVLHQGHLDEYGPHQQLLQSDGRYAEMFNLQAKGYR